MMASRSPMRSQQQRREATKRRIMGTLMEEPSPSTNAAGDTDAVDGTNPDHVKGMIEDLDGKFQQHLELLKTDLFSAKKEQHEVYTTGLLKLPKAVRQMTIRDFNQSHSCDLLSLLKSKDGVQKSVRSFKRNDRVPVLETPAPMRARPKVPGTAVRTVRRGECLYSQNGSPVERIDQGAIVATVAKKRKGNEATTVEINVGDGKYISLSNPGNVKELDAAMKATAASQLKVLADQMASLMAQLKSA